MRLEPHGNVIIGRLINLKYKGMIELPDQNKSVTFFVLVDVVGPDVKRCKVGDVVLYLTSRHLWLRDGTHKLIVLDPDVLTTVHDLDPEAITVEGEDDDARKARIAAAKSAAQEARPS